MISSIAMKAPTELITKRLDGAGYSSVGLDTAQRFVEDGPTFLFQELFGRYGEHTSNEAESFGGGELQ